MNFPNLPFKHCLIAAAIAASFSPAAQAVDYVWATGNFVPGVTAPSPLVLPDTLSITAGLKTFNAVGWDNQATVNWYADDIRFVSSSITNTGLWDAKSDNAFVYAGGGISNFFNNGSFRKSAGSGVTTIGSAIAFSNSGTIDAQTGIIDFAGGGATFNAGTQFTGAGVNRVSNNAAFNDAFNSANLVLAGGTYSGGGSGGAVLNGTADWTGGAFAGTWQVASGQTLVGKSGTDKNFNAVAFTNAGTVTWQTADNLRFISSNFVNNGVLDLQDDAGLVYAGGGISNVVNNGTFRKSAGSGVTTIGSAIAFINSGTINAQTGTIDFAGGGATFNAGTQFTGAGVNRVSNNAAFNDAFNSANLVLAGGTYAGGGTNGAVLNGTVDWTGGSFGGTWQVAAGQTLVGKSGTDKTFNAVSFTNAGTVTWQAADNLRFVSSTFVNNGVLDLQDDGGLVFAGGGISNVFNNGTFRKSGGAVSSIGTVNFINSGIIDAQTGTIDFAGGGATFNAGTQFTGAGVNRVSNNAAFNDAFNSANLVLAGGTYSAGSGGAVLNGTADWTGGAFAGTWQVASGQNLVGKSGTDKTFNAVTFTNAGTVTWQTADNLRFVSSTFVNNGVLDLQDDAGLVYAGGGASNVVNNGTLRKSGGSGASLIGTGVNFINNGIIDTQIGTIVLPNNFANPGTITGAGAVQTNLLTNSGHVAPGDGIGTLTLNGNLVQTTLGSLDLQLGNLASFDLLGVNGTASLNGTLALSCFANCHFNVNDEFIILDSTGNLSGTFAGVTMSGFATGAFDVVYDYNLDQVSLKVLQEVTAVPEPETWAMLLAGLGLVGFAAQRRKARLAV